MPPSMYAVSAAGVVVEVLADGDGLGGADGLGEEDRTAKGAESEGDGDALG